MIQAYFLNTQNPNWNILYEQYYLEKKVKNPNNIYVFFYENSPCIVLGRNQKKEEEIFFKKQNFCVIKRASGGGSVCHFKGNINYGILLSTEQYSYFKEIQNSYKIIMNLMQYAITKLIPQVTCSGISDLSVKYRDQLWKISGNAQARKKNWLLHHGTIIYNTKNINMISFFLREPKKQPEYRNKRKHNKFVIDCLPIITKFSIVKLILKELSIYFQKEILLQNINKHEIWDIVQNQEMITI